MKNFFELTRTDVEELRNKPLAIFPGMPDLVMNSSNFSEADVSSAVSHLRTIYQGRINRPFAAKILMLNQIY